MRPLLLALALSPAIFPQRCPTLFGIVTDQAGDAFADPRANPRPDLLEASVGVSGGVARLRARLAPGTLDPGVALLQFSLDIDQNPSTGFQGTSVNNTDAGLIGPEYLVTLGVFGANANVFRIGGGSTLVPGVTVLGDVIEAAVPLSVLGNDDGRINFKVIVSVALGTGGSTPIIDFAPNPGAAVGTTCSAGQIVDPTGDGTPGPNNQTPPDLTYVRGYLEAGNFNVVVTFAPGGFTPANHLIDVLLDIDRDPATGRDTANGILGADLFLQVGSPVNQATLIRLTPPGGAIAILPVTFAGDTVSVSIPLSTLGDDGLLDFRVSAFTRPAPGTTTTAFDVAPNLGSRNLTTVVANTLDAALSQTGFTFRAVQGGAVEPAKPFLLLRGTPGAMYDITVSTVSGGPWLAVNPGRAVFSLANLPQVNVSVNPAGLAPDTYYGVVTVVDSAGLTEPQLLTIVLVVLPPAATPAPIVEPAGLAFTATLNGAAPAAQRVRVVNLRAAAVNYTSAITLPAGQNWLRLVQAAGAVAPGQAANLDIAVDIAGLAAGIYTGRVTLNFSDGSTANVEVALRINPPGANASRQALSETHGGCHPTRQIPLLTLIGANFSSPTAWPTPIEAQVIDDCGAPLINGTVAASFSNGDPSLVLASQRNGRWSATWTPRNARTAGVTVTVRATHPATGVTGTAAVTGGAPENADVPVLSSGGVVGSASYNADPSAGTLISVFGSALASGISGAESLPLATRLLDTTVVLGGRALPLVFTSGGQINALIPYNLPPNTVAQMIVRRGNAISTPEPVVIADTQPAIFSLDLTGNGQGHIYRATAAGEQVLAGMGTPVTAGDVIVIYCAGLGAVDPPVAAGERVPDTYLTRTVNPVSLTMGGVEAQVLFSGLTPNFTGLYQVNAVVPAGVTPGDVPVVLTVADRASKPVTITVR